MLLMSYDKLEMVDFMRSYGPLLFPVSYLYHIHIGIIIADAFFAYLADVTKKNSVYCRVAVNVEIHAFNSGVCNIDK